MRRLARSAPLIPPAQLSMAHYGNPPPAVPGVISTNTPPKRSLAKGPSARQLCLSGSNQAIRKTWQVIRSWVRRGKFSTRRLEKPGLLLRYLEVGRVIITYRPLSNQ